MDTILALCLGITLSAACGFRLFIPPLVMSIAAIYYDLPLTSEFAWLATTPALIALATATAIEIMAYYMPVIDNLLDTIEIPTAIAVGTVLTAANLGDIDPILKWTLAAIAGGGIAGIVESFTSLTRLASTGFTGGLANPLLSTGEALSATVLSILALSLPIIAFAIVIFILTIAINKLRQYWRQKQKKKNFLNRQIKFKE